MTCRAPLSSIGIKPTAQTHFVNMLIGVVDVTIAAGRASCTGRVGQASERVIGGGELATVGAAGRVIR
jgi:hypothetical protein